MKDEELLTFHTNPLFIKTMGYSFEHHYSFLLNDEAEAKMVFDYFHKVGDAIKKECTYFDIGYSDNRFEISSGGYGFLSAIIVAQVAALIKRTGFIVAETLYSCQGDNEAEAFQIGTYCGLTNVSKEEKEYMFEHSWWPCSYELQLHSEAGMNSMGDDYEATLYDEITFGQNDLKFLPSQCRYDAFRQMVTVVMNEFKMWGAHHFKPTESWDTDLHIRERREA